MNFVAGNILLFFNSLYGFYDIEVRVINSNYSPLLNDYLNNIESCGQHGPILDLACGNGRNGLFLIENNIPVVFADIKQSLLDEIKSSLEFDPYRLNKHQASFWCTDFEQQSSVPIEKEMYGGALIFRYLHRPLMPCIKQAIKPGGILIYETFTTDQPQFGRPTNPDYLLQAGELQTFFSDWEILHDFEGVVKSQITSKQQAISQIVALKP